MSNKLHKSGELIGKTFGYWTIINKALNRKNEAFYLCRCVCNNKKEVRWKYLKNGVSKSCGCLTKELQNKKKIKPVGICAFNQLYNQYKGNAEENNRVFLLTHEEFKKLTSSICHYCGEMPSNKMCRKYGCYDYNGVDRVDNTKGYSLENCVSCCKKCNFMKTNHSVDEFLFHISKIYHNMIKK